MPWRTVKPKISFNAEQEMSQVDIAGATIRAKPNKSKVGETFTEEKRPDVFWFQLAKASARGRVVNVVADLCMEGKLDLESGINIYSCQVLLEYFFESGWFVVIDEFRRRAAGWFVVM